MAGRAPASPAAPRPRRCRTSRARVPGGCRRGTDGSGSHRSSRRSAPRARRRRRCRGAGRRGRASRGSRTPRTRGPAPRPARWQVGSSCRSASVSRAISGLVASTARHAASVTSRPRSGQPAARSSSSQSSAATCARAHSGAAASTAPVARSPSEAPLKRLHEQPARRVVRPRQHRHQVADPVTRRCTMAASAMKWSQHALNHSSPRSVGTSNTAEMLQTRCVRSGPVRRLPVAASSLVHPRLDAVVPAGTEPVRSSRRGLAGVLVERRADRRPPRLGEVVDPAPDGVARRSVAQRQDVQPVGRRRGTPAAASRPGPGGPRARPARWRTPSARARGRRRGPARTAAATRRRRPGPCRRGRARRGACAGSRPCGE